jgi:hypothetical protein
LTIADFLNYGVASVDSPDSRKQPIHCARQLQSIYSGLQLLAAVAVRITIK